MERDRLKEIVYKYASFGFFAAALLPAFVLSFLAVEHPDAARYLTILGFGIAGVCDLIAHSRLAPNRRESSFYLEANRSASFVWLLLALLYVERIYLNDPLPAAPSSVALIYFVVGMAVGLALTTNVSLFLGARYGEDGFLEWRVLRFPYSVSVAVKAVCRKARGR